jgi:hypothetical protein
MAGRSLILTVLRQHFRKPEPRIAWVAVRNDGKYWAGEYRWQGRTFSSHPHLAYRWGTESACRAAIDGNYLTDTRPKRVDLDQFVKRPSEKRGSHYPRRR